jgi:hypothetical protein
MSLSLLGVIERVQSWKNRFYIHVGTTSELKRRKVCWLSGGAAELKIRRESKM